MGRAAQDPECRVRDGGRIPDAKVARGPAQRDGERVRVARRRCCDTRRRDGGAIAGFERAERG